MRESAQAHIRNAMQVVTFLLEPLAGKGHGGARTVTVAELKALNERLAKALAELVPLETLENFIAGHGFPKWQEGTRVVSISRAAYDGPHNGRFAVSLDDAWARLHRDGDSVLEALASALEAAAQ